MIAGFPTETEEMFANAVSLVDACDLSFVHVFPYSPRPQTPAAKMPQLARPLIKERAARLRAKAEEALTRHLNRQQGRTLSCVVEKPGFARAADFTEVVFEGETPIGGISDIRIHGHDGKHVIGSLVQTQLQQAV
jgi:threonylcarbamoyladenosine tRNA methylthiotransferase MtaB